MKHVIIGAGAAGMTAAKTIRELRRDDEIVVISADDTVHSRCMLHKWISGERSEETLSFVPDDFFSQNRVRWLGGVTVFGVDTENRRVHFDGGSEAFEKLLIATGSYDFIPPVRGLREAGNVYGLHSLSDAKAIRAHAAADRVVIVGAGLVGLDAAYALVDMGKKPVLVEMSGAILPLQLDRRAANAYQEKFREAGCVFHLGRKVTDTVRGASGAVTALVLDDGTQLPCDLVIAAAGARPAVGFLERSAVACFGGVTVDRYLASNVAGVYAAGDAAGLSGIWPNAVKQGETAAKNMCGLPTVYDDTYALKNTINFFGILSLSVGRTEPSDGDTVEIREDRGRYQKVILRKGVVIGVLLQGDISGSGFWQYLVKHKINISGIPKRVWDLSFADFFGVDRNGEYQWTLPA